MRALSLALVIFASSYGSCDAVVQIGLPNECNDRNALQNIAYDARLTAIKFYFEGFVQNLTNKDKQVCYEAHVLMDDHFIVFNKTRALIENNCLPIDVAARIAMQGVCP
jgi:hypothetical protein